MIGARRVKTRKSHECFGCLITYPRGIFMQTGVEPTGKKLLRVYLCEPCMEFVAENKPIFEDCIEKGQVWDERAIQEAKVDDEH